MRIEGAGKLLRIFVGESDRHEGKPVFQAVVELLRRENLAGATVLRGIEGFGAHSRIHTARILRLSEDLPLVIEVVDRADRIDRVLPMLDELIDEGLIMIADVEVIAYRSGKSRG